MSSMRDHNACCSAGLAPDAGHGGPACMVGEPWNAFFSYRPYRHVLQECYVYATATVSVASPLCHAQLADCIEPMTVVAVLTV